MHLRKLKMFQDHFKKQTLEESLVTLYSDGMCYSEIISHSKVNSNKFSEYVGELWNNLQDVLLMSNVFLKMDNPIVHKEVEIKKTISSFGFDYKFLSTYS